MGFISPGEKLKEIRKKLDINQVVLESAGISRNFISMYECNKRKLNSETAKKIIEILKQVAKNRGMDIEGQLDYLNLDPDEAAMKYCTDKINNLESKMSIIEINEIIEICESYKFTDMLFKSFMLKGNLLYEKREYRNAFFTYQDALTFAIKESKDIEYSAIYNKLGKCKLELLNYEEALICLEKSFQYSIMCDNLESKKNALFNLSLTYKKLNKLDEALDKITKYIELIDTSEYRIEYINAMIVKANCYVAKSKHEEAIKIYEILENTCSNSNKSLLGYIYNNIACIYGKIDKWEISLDYFNKAQCIREINDEANLARTLIDKSEVYIKSISFEKAIDLIHKGIIIANKYKDNACIIHGYKLLRNIYTEKNEVDKLEKIYINLLNIYKEIEDQEQAIRILNRLCLLNINKGNIDSAKKYVEDAIKYECNVNSSNN